MATASEIIAGALNNLGVFSPFDTVDASNADACLVKLNDYLNGLNARGCVFDSVALALTDPVPIADQNVGDLKWAFAGYVAPMYGKTLDGSAARASVVADRRFVAAHTFLDPTRSDSGLLNMPGQRTWW